MNISISLLILLVFCCFNLFSIHLTKRIPKKSIRFLNHNHLDNHWSNFKFKHAKNYKNSFHETFRKEIFNNTIIKINKLNKQYNEGIISYVSGINKFADWSQEEFIAFVNKGGLKVPKNYRKSSKKITKNRNKLSIKSIDWRTKGVVNPIKDQSGCGSCWAFGSTSAIESHVAINTGILPDLSEQNLIDCVYRSSNQDGCNGGWPSEAFDYIKNKAGGIANQTSYPYTSGYTKIWSNNCKYNQEMNSGIQVIGFEKLSDEESLQAAIANIGPVTVTIQVTSNLALYKSGVFTDTSCTGDKDVNHVVTLVGYGTDNDSGKDYYIARNSWGTSHGMNGYYYFERNNNNMCSIASYAIYPIVEVPSYSNTTVYPINQITNRPDLNNTTDITIIQTTKPVNLVQWHFNGIYSWAFDCDFKDNNFTYQKTNVGECGRSCAHITGCTHFTWNSGSCWMKSGSVTRSDAYVITDIKSIICGIIGKLSQVKDHL